MRAQLMLLKLTLLTLCWSVEITIAQNISQKQHTPKSKKMVQTRKSKNTKLRPVSGGLKNACSTQAKDQNGYSCQFLWQETNKPRGLEVVVRSACKSFEAGKETRCLYVKSCHPDKSAETEGSPAYFSQRWMSKVCSGNGSFELIKHDPKKTGPSLSKIGDTFVDTSQLSPKPKEKNSQFANAFEAVLLCDKGKPKEIAMRVAGVEKRCALP
ncbi:MAG: hypothetical protein AAF202_04410 [Pseudomonadota bacterium]